MNTPLFRPEQWVLYEHASEGGDEIITETTAGFGKIVGGSYDGESWCYSVHGPMADTTYVVVPEASITHILESGSWMERHHDVDSRQSSAYTSQN